MTVLKAFVLYTSNSYLLSYIVRVPCEKDGCFFCSAYHIKFVEGKWSTGSYRPLASGVSSDVAVQNIESFSFIPKAYLRALK